MDATESTKDEAISMTQAVREAAGRISYMQLWQAIQRGQITASQPYGKFGHYRLKRSDLEKLLEPVNYQYTPEAPQTAEQ